MTLLSVCMVDNFSFTGVPISRSDLQVFCKMNVVSDCESRIAYTSRSEFGFSAWNTYTGRIMEVFLYDSV